jgi:hypothetical protein
MRQQLRVGRGLARCWRDSRGSVGGRAALAIGENIFGTLTGRACVAVSGREGGNRLLTHELQWHVVRVS